MWRMYLNSITCYDVSRAKHIDFDLLIPLNTLLAELLFDLGSQRLSVTTIKSLTIREQERTLGMQCTNIRVQMHVGTVR